MKERTIPCKYYEFEGCECQHRLGNICCHFYKEMQKCSKYDADPHGKSAKPDLRASKLNRINRKEKWENV